MSSVSITNSHFYSSVGSSKDKNKDKNHLRPRKRQKVHYNKIKMPSIAKFGGGGARTFRCGDCKSMADLLKKHIETKHEHSPKVHPNLRPAPDALIMNKRMKEEKRPSTAGNLYLPVLVKFLETDLIPCWL